MLALAGCTMDSPRQYDPELRLMFQPDMLMHVAADGVESFPEDLAVGVSAWKLPDDLTWDEASGESVEYVSLGKACSEQVVITDEGYEAPVNDLLWTLDGNPLWPGMDENLTFMAFSPYGAGCGCGKEDGVTYETDVLEDQTDFLYTLLMTDMHKVRDGWVVPLHFQHAMCEIGFRVKNRVSPEERLTVRSITVDAVRHKGDFASLRDPQWVLEESVSSLDIYDGEFVTQGLPEPIGRTWMMIPQALDTPVTVEFEYTTVAGTSIVQKCSTVPLRTMLESGRSYMFTLSVGIDDVKFLMEIL